MGQRFEDETLNDLDHEAARLRRTVGIVRSIAWAYQEDPGIELREIDRIEDLYDEVSGLPR